MAFEERLPLYARATKVLKAQTCVANDDLLLLVTRPLPRDGGMAEDHGAPEAGQLPRVWARGRKEIRESPKSERRKESVAGQCRMR